MPPPLANRARWGRYVGESGYLPGARAQVLPSQSHVSAVVLLPARPPK